MRRECEQRNTMVKGDMDLGTSLFFLKLDIWSHPQLLELKNY